MFNLTIPRNESGTRATLHIMRRLAHETSVWSIGRSFQFPEKLDELLRSKWCYVADGDHELIRTLDRMGSDFLKHGCFIGDCDDAAVMAAAILIHSAKAPTAVRFAAGRPARSPHFLHVFVLFDLDGQTYRVDPTAPIDADYSNWELMIAPL